MRQWYPESKVLANSFASTSKFYYVYKVEITPSGHFYIGYTGDISSRLSQHICGIDNAMQCESPIVFYKEAGRLLLEQLGGKYDWDNILGIQKKIRTSIMVTAIAICQQDSHAKMIERVAIEENKGNPLCLNSY